ncbi:hypothetical protein [Pontibacter vulgaris]|uniref:hypothetical protein n=1 Tax=Pontibacter vulgaris TaxID=2905679 RepID=UPI001FA7FC99|nr:hypothetical protein [Pontibacter vulgaris]
MLEYSMFDRLPFRSQTETLAKHGTLLARRSYNNWTVTLYTLNNSFVEVWSGNEIEVMSSFKNSANAIAILEPYTDAIDVQDFLDS